MIHIGFTGTQQGITTKQQRAVWKFLKNVDDDELYFHHGDCIGADEEACGIARSLGYWIIQHPPINKSKRAFTSFDEQREAKEYITRNHDIVDESSFMIATPKESSEVLRSGTWATIRYAIKQLKSLQIFYP